MGCNFHICRPSKKGRAMSGLVKRDLEFDGEEDEEDVWISFRMSASSSVTITTVNCTTGRRS